MTRIRTFCIIALFAGFFVLAVNSAGAGEAGASGSEINWHSYEAGMEEIRKNGKKGYLHFYTDWCAYCRLMDEKTFSDADVAGYINAKFIAMRVNAEQEPDLAESYRVQQFPVNWFIDSNAEPIGNQPGYIPPEQMIHMLKYVETDGYETMNFREYMEKQDN
ncbi:MAG: thioredoxin fold domain-containing protein [Desulfobacterales bacterium]|nr:thioredoxin fold domain-containing protein [Desulfobacterales bacterium]